MLCPPVLQPSHPSPYPPPISPSQVRDLLSKDPSARLELRESPERGVHVRGLKEFVVKSAAEMAAVLEVGAGGVVQGWLGGCWGHGAASVAAWYDGGGFVEEEHQPSRWSGCS